MFAIGFILVCVAYDYGSVLHLRPQPHHIFRQCDCLGMAWNYAFVDADLFSPRMCNLHANEDTSGHTAAEFPILYWVVGMLWRLVGQSEFLYRALMLALHFAGSIALYFTVLRIVRSVFWAAWLPLLFFSSPATAYFAVSFLPDVPAFDIALIGCWLFVRYRDTGQWSQLAMGLALTSLAMLLKVTSGMLFLAAWGVLVAETVWQGNGWRLFPERRAAWVVFVAAVVPVVAWYGYAAAYNEVHRNWFSNSGFSHYWKMSSEQARIVLHFARTVLVREIFSIPIWGGFLAVFTMLLALFRKLPWQLVLMHVLLLIGLALYLIGWAEALNDHDYYFIAPQVILMAQLVTVIGWQVRQGRGWPDKVWVKGAALLALVWSVTYASADLGLRTRNGGALSTPPPALAAALLCPAQIDHWRESQFWDRHSLLDVEPYARSLGIMRDDRILMADDQGWQAGLYLAGQTGWNNYTVGMSDSLSMARAVYQLRPDYFYLTRLEWAEERPYVLPYMNHPVGQHGRLTIYDLRPLWRTVDPTVSR